MAGKKGKKDPEKKAALQAKKEAKADKSALKRLKKEAQQSYEGRIQQAQHEEGAAAEELAPPTASDDLDDWLRHYRRLDEVDKVVVEDVDGFPPPRANSTLTLYEDSSSKKGKQKKELYLFGGEYFDGVSSVVVNHLLKLTIDSSSAETKCQWRHIHAPKAPPPRCAHSTVYYNHALYVFGGEISAGDAYHHYRDCWKFDLAKMEWTEIVGNKAAAPSPRSGHSAVVWKHYMVVFGGFFESSRSSSGGGGGKDATAAKWFHDVHVLDLQTEVWLDSVLSHSKLAQRPDRRSACNACVVNDDLIVHGGFSKLERKSGVVNTGALESGSGRTYMSSSGVVVVPLSAAETKVHTDAWRLPLKPLVDQGKLAWERVTWSSSRTSNPSAAAAGPSGRSGCGSVGYKDRLLVFGGVVDAEQMHHKVDSVFYNDLNVLDVGKRKWYPIRMSRSAPNGGPVQAAAAPSTRPTEEKSKKTEVQRVEGNSDSDLTDVEEEEEDDTGQPSAERAVPLEGWDLTKLRSNMFAFLDGEGNVVYENLDDEEKKAGDEDDDDEVEESKDDDGEDEKRHTKPSRIVVNSAAIKANPQTKVPEPVIRSDPLPRINARLVMVGHVLYVFGGLVEVGDREVTLDDLWRFDLKKRDKWECLFPGTMHRQRWRGAIQDDDDSYVSGGTGPDQQADDDDDSDDDEQEEAKDEGVKAGAEDGQRGQDDDSTPVPLDGESLTDYYKRTASHWTNEASSRASALGADWSDKELKREAFRLAQEHMLGMRRIEDQVNELDLVAASNK